MGGRWFAWLLGMGVLLLVGGQSIAVVTRLASGAIVPTGWQFALATAMIAGYTLAVISIGILGIWLIRELFRNGERA